MHCQCEESFDERTELSGGKHEPFSCNTFPVPSAGERVRSVKYAALTQLAAPRFIDSLPDVGVTVRCFWLTTPTDLAEHLDAYREVALAKKKQF